MTTKQPPPKPAGTSRPPRPLTPRQERFCQEYLVDLNGTAAARRAGYSAKTANEQAARLLVNVSVRARIAELQAARAERTRVRADAVLEELALVALSDIGEVLDFTRADLRLRPADEIPARARRALARVKVRRSRAGRGDAARAVEVVEFTLWPKVAALEKLAKHLGLYEPDEHGHMGEVTQKGEGESEHDLAEQLDPYLEVFRKFVEGTHRPGGGAQPADAAPADASAGDLRPPPDGAARRGETSGPRVGWIDSP